MTEEKKDKKKFTKNHQTLPSKFVTKLAEELQSNADVARLLGVSDSSISSAVNSGRCSAVTEIAAEGVWEKKFGKKAKNSAVTMFVALEASHASTIEDLVNKLGGQVTRIEV